MRKIRLIFIISIFSINLGLAQTESEIKSLLNEIGKTEFSIKIYKTEQAEKIISYGKKSLPILAKFFTDSTSTNVLSECFAKGYDEDKKVKMINVNEKLTIGQIAILITDEIEWIPLTKVMGTYSCAPIFCKKFNEIESNLSFINEFGISKFKEKYLNWLSSEKRIDWLKIQEK